MSRAQLVINEGTTSFGVGPISLDVSMARRHGWSESMIYAAAHYLGDFSRAQAEFSHWQGPVKNCPCVTCDFTVATEDLPEPEDRITRERWKQNP